MGSISILEIEVQFIHRIQFYNIHDFILKEKGSLVVILFPLSSLLLLLISSSAARPPSTSPGTNDSPPPNAPSSSTSSNPSPPPPPPPRPTLRLHLVEDRRELRRPGQLDPQRTTTPSANSRCPHISSPLASSPKLKDRKKKIDHHNAVTVVLMAADGAIVSFYVSRCRTHGHKRRTKKPPTIAEFAYAWVGDSAHSAQLNAFFQRRSRSGRRGRRDVAELRLRQVAAAVG